MPQDEALAFRPAPSEFTLPDSAQVKHDRFWRSTRFFLNPLMGISGRLISGGEETLPKEGRYILAAKHLSMRDIPAVGSALLHSTNNTATFIGKRELWKWYLGPIGIFLDLGGVACYDRSSPLNSEPNKKAEAVVNNAMDSGGIIITFPEGTRTPGQEIGPSLKEGGIGMLAVAHGAKVVFVGLAGTDSQFGRKAVYFGPQANQDRIKIDRVADPRGFLAASREVAGQVRPGMQAAVASAALLLQ